jgi:hypothetical protein
MLSSKIAEDESPVVYLPYASETDKSSATSWCGTLLANPGQDTRAIYKVWVSAERDVRKGFAFAF